MSHQTGIRGNEKLKSYFGECHTDNVRAIKIVIEDEKLTLKDTVKCDQSWEKDFDKTLSAFAEQEQPCYVLYRLDTKNSVGYEWLFISWSPDEAVVRQKMLYASTKATLKQEFGSAHLKDDYFCSSKEDATLLGYKKHLKSVSEPAPLTEREEALKFLSIQDPQPEYSIDSRQQTMSGVSFPMDDRVHKALVEMSQGQHTYAQFRIDIEEEKIYLVKANNIGVTELSAQVPDDAARYHLFMFKHTHEGDHLENTVFIYSMPGYKCSIKERMLYSSCKAAFLQSIEHYGIILVKNIEIDEAKELTEEFLQDAIHPKRNLHRPAFAKPKGPPNRGAKRITKTQPAE